MHSRSMGGRIYQQRTFRPKSITLNNPQQRKLQYPIKGDTSFQPDEHGKKHYLSPKHAAIHSIIFNENHQALMREKQQLIQRLSKNRSFRQFDQKAQRQKIHNLNNYLNDYVIKQTKNNNHLNPFPPYNNFNSQMNSINSSQINQRVSKGHLFRQGSMNQVLKPYSPASRQNNEMSRISSNYLLYQKSNPHNNNQLINQNKSFNLNLNPEYPRQINPNYLNSIF